MDEFKYETAYISACSAMEQDAVSKLGRVLEPNELSAIRNAGSFMMLEAVDRTISCTEDPKSLAIELAKTGIAFEDRRNDFCKGALPVLEEKIGRSLTDEENVEVEATKYVTDVMTLMIDIGTSRDPSSVVQAFCKRQYNG